LHTSWQRHARLLGSMGLGPCEQNTTPSASERISKLRKDSSMESPSGSVELLRHRARETMPWVINKENRAIAQIVRYNGVAAGMVGKD